MIIHQNSKSIIELTKNNTVVKTLKYGSVSKRWYNAYNQLSKNDDRFVKVLKILNDNSFEMEYISEPHKNLEHIIKNSECYDVLTKDDIINITSLLPDIFVKTLEFSKTLNNNEFFIHTDILIPNFLFTDSKKIKIIDPDSFSFVENLDYVEKYYMSSINVMYNIQKVFNHKGK